MEDEYDLHTEIEEERAERYLHRCEDLDWQQGIRPTWEDDND